MKWRRAIFLLRAQLRNLSTLKQIRKILKFVLHLTYGTWSISYSTVNSWLAPMVQIFHTHQLAVQVLLELCKHARKHIPLTLPKASRTTYHGFNSDFEYNITCNSQCYAYSQENTIWQLHGIFLLLISRASCVCQLYWHYQWTCPTNSIINCILRTVNKR